MLSADSTIYAYDRTGNRLTQEGMGQDRIRYAYDAESRLIELEDQRPLRFYGATVSGGPAAGAQSWLWEALGEAGVGKTAGATYQVTLGFLAGLGDLQGGPAGRRLQFRYNGDRIRISRTAGGVMIQYLNDGLDIVAEMDSSGAPVHNTPSPTTETACR